MTAISTGMSAEMEDYLEAIAALVTRTGTARVTDIAEQLAVRKPSVTQALHALAAKGYLQYSPYTTPTLTDAGRRIAERVQQRHDVIRSFLMQVLLVDAAVADANACRLEHAIDKEVLEHLTHFMDFMQRCPRGGAKWIRGYEYFCDPAKEADQCERCMQMALAEFQARPRQPTTEEQTMTLADLETGRSGRIVRVGTDRSMRRRMVDMGAVKGTKVTVVKVAPLGDPIEVKIKGYNLTLRKEEAAAITIETLLSEEQAT